MTTLNKGTFDFIQPTLEQQEDMRALRVAAQAFADVVEKLVPDGPDKTVAQRKIREAAMWANVAISRTADGAPRN